MINRAAAASFAALLLAIAGGTRAAQTVPDGAPPQISLDALRDGVDRGDPVALVRMAVEMQHGVRAKLNLDGALDYLNRAAKQNCSAAHCALGMMYMCGRYGTHVDIATAQEHLKTAADAGDGPAMVMLAQLLEGKQGIGNSESTALYQKAYPAVKTQAEAGDLEAMFNLGQLYFFGGGVAKDPELEVALVPEGGRGRPFARHAFSRRPPDARRQIR